MSFDKALAFALRWEGGYVNHPNDPGGATNKGVTQRTYDAWNLRNGSPKQDVRFITDKTVHAIYEVDYWLAAHCDRLPEPLDLVVFDTAVNMGVGRAVRFLQQIVGTVPDGDFGPATASAVREITDPQGRAYAYCTQRLDYYQDLVARNAKLGVFLKGWTNRVVALQREVAAS